MSKLSMLLVGLALVAQSAMAGPPARTTQQVLKEIGHRINTYVYYTIFDDVNVTFDAGVATLSGKVSMGYKRNEIASRVARIEGVREVRNEIGLFPRSQLDDVIRGRLARIIYGDLQFRQYQPNNAPIHIVVEHARVTLKGVVTDGVERMRARALIASTPGVLSVTNELQTEAEARAEREKVG